MQFLENIVNQISTFLILMDKNILIAIPSTVATIFIPIVILLVNYEEYPFDRKIIFKSIINLKHFIFLILIDIVFLSINVQFVQLLSRITSFLIIIFALSSLVKTYKWLYSYNVSTDECSYQQKLRIKYLDTLKKSEIIQTWRNLLNNEQLKKLNQYGLVNSFIKSAEKIEKSDSTEEKRELSPFLNNFAGNLNNIHFTYDDYKEIIKYSLIGYYEYILSGKYSLYCIKNLFWSLFRIATAADSRHDRSWFGNALIEVINDCCNNFEQQGEFLEIFSYDLFSELDKNNIGICTKMIKLFSQNENLTVTKEKLTSSDKKINANHVINGYIKYAKNYLNLHTKRNRKNLENITKYIFPNINLIFWFDIHTLYFSGFPIDRDKYQLMVDFWCSNARNFGLISFLHPYFEEENENKFPELYKQNLLKTIYILKIIHPKLEEDEHISNMKKSIELCKEKEEKKISFIRKS